MLDEAGLQATCALKISQAAEAATVQKNIIQMWKPPNPKSTGNFIKGVTFTFSD